jgi:hypothetical protein
MKDNSCKPYHNFKGAEERIKSYRDFLIKLKSGIITCNPESLREDAIKECREALRNEVNAHKKDLRDHINQCI